MEMPATNILQHSSMLHAHHEFGDCCSLCITDQPYQVSSHCSCSACSILQVGQLQCLSSQGSLSSAAMKSLALTMGSYLSSLKNKPRKLFAMGTRLGSLI